MSHHKKNRKKQKKPKQKKQKIKSEQPNERKDKQQPPLELLISNFEISLLMIQVDSDNKDWYSIFEGYKTISGRQDYKA